LCSSKDQKKQKVFFVVFFAQIRGKNTNCGAYHELHVGIPVILIRQSGSIAAGAFHLRIQGAQLQKFFPALYQLIL
jgi:hypothetical protein